MGINSIIRKVDMNVIEIVLCLSKSLLFCIKLFGIRNGIKLPIIISYKTKVLIRQDAHIYVNQYKFAQVILGLGGSININEKSKNYLILEDNCNLTFHGTAHISKGFSIRVEKESTLEFGNNFIANKNLEVSASNKIILGNNILVGWNVVFRDGDGHKVFYTKNKNKIIAKTIQLSDHIWIAANCTLLGNTDIHKNSVISTQSLLNKNYTQNSLIAGIPAKEIKKIYTWQK